MKEKVEYKISGVKFSLKFAWLMFKRNLKTTIFITLIFALILSLPTLTTSVNNGFGTKIKKDFSKFIGDFVIKTTNENQDLTLIYSKLNQIPFIETFVPVYMTNALLEDKKGNRVGCNIVVTSKFNKLVEKNDLNKHLIEGFIEDGKKEILIGSYLTKSAKFKMFPKPLDVESGDIIKIDSVNPLLDGKSIKIMGIYEKEPSLSIYALLPAKVMGKNFKPNRIIIYLKDNYKPEIDKIYKILVNEFPQYAIHSIKEEMTIVDNFLETFSIVSSITFFFGTLIAIVIIYSLISINVRNKRTEIGILRALGIKERFIIYSYLFLTLLYLLTSFFISLIILKSFEIFFQNYPIHSPFGLVTPALNYYSFITNFIKLTFLLLIVSYIPIRRVIKEDLLSQIRS